MNMKLRKRILALLIAVLVVFNYFSSAYAARGSILTLSGDIESVIDDQVEYGSTVSRYQFEESILDGVEEGDEVYLVAEAQYDSTNVGDTTLTLSNFSLEGSEAEHYTVPTIQDIVKQINIYEKALTLTDDITNAITDIEYGSAISKYQFEDDILNGVEDEDEVHLVADAQYDSIDVGNVQLTLSNFRLEGEKAGCYLVPLIEEPVVKQININKKLTLTGMISDAIENSIEYGSTTSQYQFKDGILDGVEENDEVYLVAEAVYSSTDAGNNIQLKLSDFRLEGADAEYYIIPLIEKPAEKRITISKKEIKIAPEKTYNYYGQEKPKTIKEIADYTSQIITGDDVKITAEFRIETGKDIKNDYSIWINGKIGCDNNNYNVILDETVKYEIREYAPSETAVTDTDDYAGVKKAILEAPEKFLISTSKDGTFTQSVEINLIETQAGEEVYYLRNNDPLSEYNQAISNEKIYTYTSVQTLPKIESITIRKINENAVLNFLTFGVFGNGEAEVTIEAAGAAVEQETTIYFGEEGAYDSKIGTAEQRHDGKYYYTAVFTLDEPIGEGDIKSRNLRAYAVNSSGEGGKSAKLTGISNTDGNTKTVDSKPFVLDNVEPVISIGEIISNSKGNKSTVRISDVHSGIAKVEYGWDLDEDRCNDQKNPEERKLGFKQNEYTDKYIEYKIDNKNILHELEINLKLNHRDEVRVIGDQHTVYVKVTDNAGNIYAAEFQDPIGNDMDAPNISGVEIRKAETGVLDSILRFITLGTFSNDSVEIAVTADDNESVKGYDSGIKTVTLNGKEMLKNDEGEYVFKLSPDNMLSVMSVTVKDNAGWSTTAAITDISGETGYIKGGDLIVEDDAPVINFQFSSAGRIDSSGKAWYGAGDADETLKVMAADNIGTVRSGLYSVKITDNDEILYTKTGFSKIDSEYAEIYEIGEFADGMHTIVVSVEDNAGNTFSDSKTFYVDCAPPESGIITMVNPASLTIGGYQWFDKDDIITFRVDSSDTASGLSRISLEINGQAFNFVHDEILSDENGYYVTVDTKNINPNHEHKYIITGTVTDVANNVLTLDQLIVYKDFENPVISKFTVEKKDEALDKILNVLTFGTYSNDDLIFKAYVSDMEFDSGVDYVTVLYMGLTDPKVMKNEGNGVFSVEIPIDAEVFQSDIIVTAYDKYGKSSISCPNLENAENGNVSGSKFVMIETLKPIMALSLPAGDGITRTDGQTWYNSNKQIELKVQDENSGIRNINFEVNGNDILSDKTGTDLLKIAEAESASERNTAEQSYIFDTDFFTSITEEPTDGKYTIQIEITDNAGNITVYETMYYIDAIAPVIDKIDFVPAASDGTDTTSDFIESLKYGFYFKTDFTVTINVSDELPSSGLNEVQYRFVPYQNGIKKDEISGSKKITDGQAILTVPKEFKGQIFVEAFDNVMNRSGEKTTKAYVTDNDSPEIDIIKNVSTPHYDAAGNPLYIVDNSITVVVTDMISGIKEVGYAQSAEVDFYDRLVIDINETEHKVGDHLGNGWSISAVDMNLVTQIAKTFTFVSDDNDVALTFDALDNSLNKIQNVRSEKFTVDKTNPVINVVFHEDDDNDAYYDLNRIAEISVVDRNFNADLIKVLIENTFGTIPSFSFMEVSKTEHTTVINFDEGDYIFDVSGADLGNREAMVTFSGGNEKLFYVDKTRPVTEENFASFGNGATENSFNSDKTVTIHITEHNFDPMLVNLRVLRKDAGEAHDTNSFIDITSEILSGVRWQESGDVHTISFTFSRDAVYQVEMTPNDLAGNAAGHQSTVVFEIDKAVPVVKAKNGSSVTNSNIEFLDIYPYSRKDDSIPTIEFDDLNVDHINYTLTVFIPDYTSSEAATVIKPKQVYLEADPDKSGSIKGNIFTLPNFTEDGIYALELIAVDVAGNESLLNLNTYARMVDQDVLAYVLDSNLTKKTGIYSFQYENGDTISKRPDNFSNIEIMVLTKKDTGIDIVLRDNNADEINTHLQATVDSSIYGIEICNYVLESNFFKENFQDDVDVELYLTVKNEGNKIDLGKLHIDNIAPTCFTPKEFKSWNWYYGENDRTIIISDISELIDESQCKVYDNGKEIDFKYLREDNTITFTLKKGWHDVGIVLDDMAGNANNIQEKSNIHIGFFWLWIIMGSSAVFIIIIAAIIMRTIKKRRSENE